jgi:hypothetical protein
MSGSRAVRRLTAANWRVRSMPVASTRPGWTYTAPFGGRLDPRSSPKVCTFAHRYCISIFTCDWLECHRPKFRCCCPPSPHRMTAETSPARLVPPFDSHVKRLRKKFRATDGNFDLIETLYGVGYRIKEFSEASRPSAS